MNECLKSENKDREELSNMGTVNDTSFDCMTQVSNLGSLNNYGMGGTKSIYEKRVGDSKKRYSEFRVN